MTIGPGSPSRVIARALPDDRITWEIADSSCSAGVPAVFSSDTGHGVFLRSGRLDESRADPLCPRGSAQTALLYSPATIVFTTRHSTQALIPGGGEAGGSSSTVEP